MVDWNKSINIDKPIIIIISIGLIMALVHNEKSNTELPKVGNFATIKNYDSPMCTDRKVFDSFETRIADASYAHDKIGLAHAMKWAYNHSCLPAFAFKGQTVLIIDTGIYYDRIRLPSGEAVWTATETLKLKSK